MNHIHSQSPSAVQTHRVEGETGGVAFSPTLGPAGLFRAGLFAQPCLITDHSVTDGPLFTVEPLQIVALFHNNADQ